MPVGRTGDGVGVGAGKVGLLVGGFVSGVAVGLFVGLVVGPAVDSDDGDGVLGTAVGDAGDVVGTGIVNRCVGDPVGTVGSLDGRIVVNSVGMGVGRIAGTWDGGVLLDGGGVMGRPVGTRVFVGAVVVCCVGRTPVGDSVGAGPSANCFFFFCFFPFFLLNLVGADVPGGCTFVFFFSFFSPFFLLNFVGFEVETGL